MRRAVAAAVLSLAFAGPAYAGTATIVARDLPLGPVRSLATLAPTRTFDLVGLHWQGPGGVFFRTRSVAGRWSAWRKADTDGDRRGRWQLGTPYWTGSSDRLDYRVTGRISRLRAFYVWSPVEHLPYRTESIAGSPQIVPRSGWGALESIRRRAPRYASAVHFAVVHHTAGSNNYTPAQSAAIVRGIELYHVKGNGWNDIGYNFLVDRYGQVFEGRYGGITRNVIGAHAGGFNTGSVGIAVIGSYGLRAPLQAARDALVGLLAWRLDLAHVDPLSTLTWISGGNARFHAGVPVFLRAISGHRDTGFTDCPGTAFYRELDSIAAQVAATGLPKLYGPVAQGSLGGPIHFGATLTSGLPWSVMVTLGGETVARGTGSGATVSWTWDSSHAVPGHYTWTIEAGPTVRPATGSIGTGGAAPPTPVPSALLTDLAISPSTISPNGDGYDDSSTIAYALHGRAAVTAVLQDAAGNVVRTLFTDQQQSARQISFPLPVDDLGDGRYNLDVAALAADGTALALDAQFVVDRTLSGLTVSPSSFTPGSGSAAFSFALAKPAQVRVAIVQNGQPLTTVFSGQLQAGPQSVTWDGSLPGGPAPAGHYDVQVTAVDDIGQAAQSVGFDVVSPGG